MYYQQDRIPSAIAGGRRLTVETMEVSNSMRNATSVREIMAARSFRPERYSCSSSNKTGGLILCTDSSTDVGTLCAIDEETDVPFPFTGLEPEGIITSELDFSVSSMICN